MRGVHRSHRTLGALGKVPSRAPGGSPELGSPTEQESTQEARSKTASVSAGDRPLWSGGMWGKGTSMGAGAGTLGWTERGMGAK